MKSTNHPKYWVLVKGVIVLKVSNKRDACSHAAVLRNGVPGGEEAIAIERRRVSRHSIFFERREIFPNLSDWHDEIVSRRSR